MRKTKEIRKQFVDAINALGELDWLVESASVSADEKLRAVAEIKQAIRCVAMVETILFPLDIGPV